MAETSSSFDTLLAALRQDISTGQRLPVATYRLQFNAAFTFVQAQEIVGYLAALGITDCYASPYLKARSGSTHGYDIVDPHAINPEIGSEAEYESFVEALQQQGMGQLLDIVPNHMGVIGGENRWWRDVLEHGPASIYARFFDIDWKPRKRALQHKILLPVLGRPYGEALEHQELRLTSDDGRFMLQYFDHLFPIAPCTVPMILRLCITPLEQHLGAEHPQTLELYSIMSALQRLAPRTALSPELMAVRYREVQVSQRRLASLHATCAVWQEALSQALETFNGTQGVPESFDPLHRLLEAQSYRLSYWRVAAHELNTRRFFDIVHLAGVCVEDPVVFDTTHALILQLLETGKISGVRVDHPDGLCDPLGYFQRLQYAYVLGHCRRVLAAHPAGEVRRIDPATLARQFMMAYGDQPLALEGRPLYVVVEKILEAHESLPEDWPVHGTTGYDFLNQLNGLFVDREHAEAFRKLYMDFVEDSTPYADMLYAAKGLILHTSLASELESLVERLEALVETHRHWRDLPRPTLRQAVAEVIACFPVYRTYLRGQQDTPSSVDRTVVEQAILLAQRRNATLDAAVFEALHDILTLQYRLAWPDRPPQAHVEFVQKFQQLTGPVMAKGLEDTVCYRYTPLVSLNEVGGDPDHFGDTLQSFHQYNLHRQRYWPYALLATSTHDTKRSEDVRARLNVLSEMPQTWHESVWRWHRLNAPLKMTVDGQLVPSRQEEYLLYQTLLGAWPFEPLTQSQQEEFLPRIQAYMQKALREAKVHTNWITPHTAYEDAVQQFVAVLLDERRSTAFLQDFRQVQHELARYGVWNSLAQTLLKITAPGVPDTYQGSELWDLSLVDPDNRRPVDYARRQQMLTDMQRRWHDPGGKRGEFLRSLLDTLHDGRLKLFVMWQALTFRRAQTRLFLDGEYIPLDVVGAQSHHVCAFARRYDSAVVIILVPRLVRRLLAENTQFPFGHEVWEDTRVLLPERVVSSEYVHLFTDQRLSPQSRNGQSGLWLRDVLAEFPVALLHRVR